MERRVALAIALMLIVLILPSILFPPPPPPPAPPESRDTVTAVAPETVVVEPPAAPAAPAVRVPGVPQPEGPAATATERIVTVESPLVTLRFSTRGARLLGATLKEYETFAPGDTGRAELMPPDSRFLEYSLVLGSDTLALHEWQFTPTDTLLRVEGGEATLGWRAERGPLSVEITHVFRPDTYLFDVRAAVTGIPSGGLLLVRLGPHMGFVEADSADNLRAYAVVTKANKTESVKFSSIDGETRALQGPFGWVAIKSKYFMAAVLATSEGQPRFGGALVTGMPKTGKFVTDADVLVSLPGPTGAFAHSVYVGPQEFRRLARIGHDLEDINPYGWFLRPIIRPFANLIVRILLWMHETLSLPYGWVLILFGLAVRGLLWPLNQKAMRSSVAMQAIQPELKAIQERYKQDPPRLQQEMMKLYREHKVNPLGGCLPLLIPMPVLFALFFVFRETIEFRGVPFLWLPDLSRADPYFIIPILMGLSMYAVTRIGQIGVPPNPQAKMMLYLMPGMMTVLFLRFSSGLNLYYAVSNIASIPQQWLIARERLKRVGKR